VTAAGVETFMATMVAQSRPVSMERALALARERYRLEARATRLTGERDENFHLLTPDGAQYVLKVAHAAEDPRVSALLTAALLHVEAADPSLPCPRVVRTLEGATQARFAAERGTERTARVLTYLPGVLLSAARRSPQQRAACGHVGACLTHALRSFEHPAAHREIIWDVRQAAHMRELLAELAGFPFRSDTADLLARLVPAIESRLPCLRHQVVHNDLNPRNILVDPADDARVTGVIDFGDLTYTALAADVAVAAAELIPEDCTAVAEARAAVCDVARAYHARLPLLAEEVALLGTMVAARLLANVVVHEWHVHHNPASSHYRALAPAFMRSRLEIAAGLLREEITL
jgi:Ser/Thr protein kinase RdoA (MazF antagonist)